MESFRYAMAGIIYSFNTQRNVRIHFFMAFLVLAVGCFFDLSAFELLLVIFTIAMVIITEMINTAIETTIDMVTEQYHPLAEIAKNVAAGAVLIATLNALAVGYVIFGRRLLKIFLNLV
ncbi:MAG: diacylglycerol kinase [Tepidanaerobacteraceae bacterium]|nr:diacylglycerol kinase [Tepidanaerobacteraceae bacterium]